MSKKILSSTLLTLFVVLFSIPAWALDFFGAGIGLVQTGASPANAVVAPKVVKGVAQSFQATRNATEAVIKIMKDDEDGDGTINGLDDDIDGDGVPNDVDACPFDDQNRCKKGVDGKNADGDDDVLNEDADADGIPDADDNCMDVPNEDQTDDDGDGVGDFCDADYDPSAGLSAGFDEGGACSLSPASGLNGGLLALMLSILASAIRRRK